MKIRFWSSNESPEEHLVTVTDSQFSVGPKGSTLALAFTDAQALMNRMWDTGMRPASWGDSRVTARSKPDETR